jgi:hypothetical protein
MCLRTEQIEPQIATEDIICYKIIRKNMTSLYYNKFKWEFGKLYKTEMQFYNSEQITQAFHSYKSYKDVREAYSRTTEPCVVVKCTIPKDTSYYTGNHGVCEGYASEKIIINEIIPVKELYPYFDFDNYPYKEGDKIIIEFTGDIKTREGVIQNIQPYAVGYRVSDVDMIVSFEPELMESKLMLVPTEFDGKELRIKPLFIHPELGQREMLKEIKIKED